MLLIYIKHQKTHNGKTTSKNMFNGLFLLMENDELDSVC